MISPTSNSYKESTEVQYAVFWATSTLAKLLCWTKFEELMFSKVRPVESLNKSELRSSLRQSSLKKFRNANRFLMLKSKFLAY